MSDVFEMNTLAASSWWVHCARAQAPPWRRRRSVFIDCNQMPTRLALACQGWNLCAVPLHALCFVLQVSLSNSKYFAMLVSTSRMKSPWQTTTLRSILCLTRYGHTPILYHFAKRPLQRKKKNQLCLGSYLSDIFAAVSCEKCTCCSVLQALASPAAPPLSQCRPLDQPTHV